MSITFRGQPAEAFFEHDPGEPQTWTDPGSSESIGVYAVETAHGMVTDFTAEEEEELQYLVERLLERSR
jgi:hypothetical protein